MTTPTKARTDIEGPNPSSEPVGPATSGTDGWWGFLAIVIYALVALITAAGAAVSGHPEGFLALLMVPLAIAARSKPWLVATALIVGGVWLRIVFAQFGPLTDQLVVSQAAADVALSGGNPYGIGYAESSPPGAPYPYGPLALLAASTWLWGEIFFAAATMVLIAWTRSWLTLAFYAGSWTIVDLTTAGLNDVTPGFFITAGLLALKYKPWLGAVLIAVAAGIKPYAGAWFPGVIGAGGLTNLAVLLVTSLVIWLPAGLMWGPLSMLRSYELTREIHPVSENALNIPILRILALPIAVVALFLKQWWMAAVTGLLIFVVVLFFDFWASQGYFVAIAPITGILLEMGLRNLRQHRRSRVVAEGVAVE